MRVTLRRQRDNTFRKFWYGEYRDANGARKIVNVGKWKGTPNESGNPKDPGDAVFELSRQNAQQKLMETADEARTKGRAEHLTARLIKSKTGRSVDYARIDALCELWRTLGREKEATEAHLTNCDAHFLRFTEFMTTRNPSATFLYEITPDDAAAFVKVIRGTFAPATAQYGVRMLNKAFDRFLPVGAANPFASFIGRRGKSEDGVVHRKPFTPEELQTLLTAAKDDAFMYPLIVTAACTGMRRGDVCSLKWADVDLDAGMLTVKTSKTGGNVEIPIFAPLQAVLKGLGKPGKGFVYPEAAEMLKVNANGLTWRFKKLVTKAFEKPDEESVACPASEILDEGLDAIREHVSDVTRRERMLEVLRLYSAGKSLRHVETTVGCARATVSADLHAVQGWIGKTFMRGGTDRTDIKSAMARVSRIERDTGQRAASVMDWHALRATWVTLALSAGVPVELVRRVTGHATVEVVLKHYFRPDRDQFKAALTGALPEVLTGKVENRKSKAEIGEGETADRRLQTADQAKGRKAGIEDVKKEILALFEKVAAGTATKAEVARFKKLAAGV